MSNTRKKIVSTNLFELRSQYGLSQKELGQILGVTKKTISNYELEKSNLPLESALILCKKYSCTLDWIYCHDSKNSASDSKEKPFEPFIVDIRDFISFSNNEVHITLPYYALYANPEPSQEEPTKEQLEEATSFIKELLALSKSNTKKEK